MKTQYEYQKTRQQNDDLSDRRRELIVIVSYAVMIVIMIALGVYALSRSSQ